jgi:hypothetical protein
MNGNDAYKNGMVSMAGSKWVIMGWAGLGLMLMMTLFGLGYFCFAFSLLSIPNSWRLRLLVPFLNAQGYGAKGWSLDFGIPQYAFVLRLRKFERDFRIFIIIIIIINFRFLVFYFLDILFYIVRRRLRQGTEEPL